LDITDITDRLDPSIWKITAVTVIGAFPEGMINFAVQQRQSWIRAAVPGRTERRPAVGIERNNPSIRERLGCGARFKQT
jgi:hypothetical protein